MQKYSHLKMRNDLAVVSLEVVFPTIRPFYDDIKNIEECTVALTELLSRLQKAHAAQSARPVQNSLDF